MPDNSIGEEAESALRGAEDFIRLGQSDDKACAFHLNTLHTLDNRLSREIEERTTKHISDLSAQEGRNIEKKWQELNTDPRFIRANAEQKAHQQTFDHLRQINGGAFPRNISPVLYAIPLILIGVN